MDSPPYLVDQFAATAGLSNVMAKRAMLLRSYAEQDFTLAKACDMVGIAKSTGKRVARKPMIDFTDYRPYAAKEKKGEARPAPFARDTARPASELPLFS